MSWMDPVSRLFILIESLFFVGFGLIVFINRRRQSPQEARRRLWTKYVWYLIIVNSFLILIFLGYPFFQLAVLVIVLGGLREFFSGLSVKGTKTYKTFGICLGLVIGGSAVFLSPPGFYLAALLLLLLVLILPVCSRHPEFAVEKTSSTLLAVFFISILTSHLCFIENLENGPSLLAFLYVLLTLNDGFSELFGRMLGKKPLCEKISPNKTVGGAIGGMLSTLAGSLIFSFLLVRLPLYQCALAGLIIGTAGQLGDLVSSVFKRDLGIKDFGSLFPIHGGVIDRFDSLIFTAPIFYAFLRLIY